MRNMHSTLLAGVAGLALLAATGMASAQGTSNSPGASNSQGAGPATMQPSTGKGTGASSGVAGHQPMGHSAQTKGGPSQHNAQNAQPSKGGMSSGQTASQQKSTMPNGNRSANSGAAQSQNKAAQAKPANRSHNRTAERAEQRNHMARGGEERRGNARTAQGEQHNLKGLQGNTSVPMQGAQNDRGMGSKGVKLSEQQRTDIRKTVIDSHNAPRVGNVKFDVRVGTVVPRGDVHFAAVPETLIRIHPRWRGYRYFVYNDEVVIVDPHDMRIVEVIYS